MKERLQKYIARCGITSRRKAEELIISGKVQVNGCIVKDYVIVDDEKDVIKIDGKEIKPEENKVYIILNKPEGVITAVKDNFNRKTVLDIVKVKERIFPIGRLDYDTSGLLILTNDGDFAHEIMHPSKEIDKVYVAEVKGIPDKEDIEVFRKGIELENYITARAEMKIISKMKDTSLAEVTIHEGRKRQIRKMFGKIKHPVISLKRIKVGKLDIGNLKQGEWRYLTQTELNRLLNRF